MSMKQERDILMKDNTTFGEWQTISERAGLGKEKFRIIPDNSNPTKLIS